MENGTFTVVWKIWPSCRERKNINANLVRLKFNIGFKWMQAADKLVLLKPESLNMSIYSQYIACTS